MDKILIVDDDQNICELLKIYIENNGFQAIIANDGQTALKLFNSESPSLILLDVMLPYMDGFDILREIRKKSNVPAIMITAKGETFDKVLGLELGADDYITKPFDTKEVAARIKAVLRRVNKNNSQQKIITFENLTIDLTKYELIVNNKKIETPPKELELLYFLASHQNQVFTRKDLLDKVWGFEYYADTRTIDVHIKRLRAKLENVSTKWSLQTVWGVGYKFEVK